MLRKHQDTYVGILNDLDLSTKIETVEGEVMPESARSMTTRTGTWRYRAIDLHDGKPPIYRHDLESLFYVLVEVVSLPALNPTRHWNAQTQQQLATSKLALINMSTRVYSDEWVQVKYKGLGYHIRRIQAALRRGIFAQADYAIEQMDAEMLQEQGGNTVPFDEVTQGGHVTFDIYETALMERLSV